MPVAAPNGRLERIDLGADLRVARGGEPARLVHTEKSYFPSVGPQLGPISRFFEGEATSEVGLNAGLRRDFWISVAPDTERLAPRVKEGDRVFTKADQASALTDAQVGAQVDALEPPVRRRHESGSRPHVAHRVAADLY